MTSSYTAIVTKEEHGVFEHTVTRSEIKPDEIVAQVAFSGLNHIDVGQAATGAYITTFPYILGKEWSGRVVEVGSAITDLKVGDEVMGLGYVTGSLQQQITISRNWVCKKPTKLSLEDAATIPHRYAAIMVALFLKDGLQLPLEPSAEQKAQTQIIIWGAASGSGMYAIQVLKAIGYETVLAVASLKQKDKLLNMGATEVFDRSDSNVTQLVRAKYPHIKYGLVGQADDAGWNNLVNIVEPATSASQQPAHIAYIIRLEPSHIPEGVVTKRTVAFSILRDPAGRNFITEILPKVIESRYFQVPKSVEVVSEGSFLERVQKSLPLVREKGDISLAIKVD